jgi:hypothetical protein
MHVLDRSGHDYRLSGGNEMTWTHDKPKKPGWYWWKRWHGSVAGEEIVTAEVVESERGLLALFPRHSKSYNSLVIDIAGEWAGPIYPPGASLK